MPERPPGAAALGAERSRPMALARLYTVPEAAEALRVTPAAIRRWIWQRRLTVVRLGTRVVIEEEELRRWITAGRHPAWPSTQAVRPRTAAGRSA